MKLTYLYSSNTALRWEKLLAAMILLNLQRLADNSDWSVQWHCQAHWNIFVVPSFVSFHFHTVMLFDIITTPTLQYKGCTHSRILYRTVVWEMVEVGWGGGGLVKPGHAW